MTLVTPAPSVPTIDREAASLRPYRRWPFRDCGEQARRAVHAATQGRRHRMVMAPPRLVEKNQTRALDHTR